MAMISRRGFIETAGAAAVAVGMPWGSRPAVASTGSLTIAYSASITAWDPNSGPQAVNPSFQSLYRSVFDPYINQNPDLSLAPGVMEKYGWNEERSKISLTLRDGVKWHDGSALTMEDVVWNLERLSDPKAGSPLRAVFASNKNFKVDGKTVTFDVDPWRANMLERLSFLGIYLLPKAYFEKVGKDGFEKQPIGSGPYMFDQYERGSFLRLKAFKDYWGGPPPFETVVYKFTPDASSRVAEIERGTSDVTMDMPYEEYDRLKAKPEFSATCRPVSDVALLFLSSNGAFADDNVRKAACMSINKKAIVDRIHRGYATVLDTLLAPEYKAYDPSITVPFDPKQAQALLAKSGYSPSKPVELTIQVTRGFKPKDYESIQAIVQMWRQVGIKGNIEVYEMAKHFELRAQGKLGPAAFAAWGNASADPESSLGTALHSKQPHSSWKGGQMDATLEALFREKDEAKRLEGYKAANRVIAENAYVLPLFQLYQPVVFKKDLKFTPHVAGFVTATQFSRAS
jgi:peptide/nickel transport system substrate-binding protein